MMREGVQEAEARIVVERALLDKALRAKMGEEKAKEYQDLLDLRTRCYRTACKGSWVWFAGSGWLDRNEKLFAMAGEVEALRSK